MMDETRGIRAFAVLRGLLGAWLLWTALPNLDHSFIERLPATLDHFAQNNPYPFYHWFLQDVAMVHVSEVGTALSAGQALMGAALLLGFLTQAVAFFGALFAFNLFLSVGHVDFYHQGFCFFLLIMFASLVFGDAGRYYGLDGFLFRHSGSEKSGGIKFKDKKQKQVVEKLSRQIKDKSSKKKSKKAESNV